MKVRVNRAQEFVIGDYTRGTKTFDALIFGYYEGTGSSTLREGGMVLRRRHARCFSRSSEDFRLATVRSRTYPKPEPGGGVRG
jgi:hypothetical protein